MRSLLFNRPIFLAIIFAILAGCNVTKPLGPREALLVENKIQTNNHKISAEELNGYLQQRPNKKLFGMFRANIALYNMGNKGKDSKFKKWLRNTVGSPPVIYDSSLSVMASKQMALFLANKGYFNSSVKDTVVIRKKKAKVYYKVKSPVPYRIRKIEYSIPDTQLMRFVMSDTSRTLIRKGENYDAYKLDDERTRISSFLNNRGFFMFTPAFIVFRIDSAVGSRMMDITMEINNQVIPSGETSKLLTTVPHNRYYINRIYIFPDYDHLEGDSVHYDTLVRHVEGSRKKKVRYDYYFLYNDKMTLKPSTIMQSVMIEPGDIYNIKDVNQTYSSLSNLQVFKYVNLRFSPAGEARKDTVVGGAVPLDCRVLLSRSAGHAFSVSGDVTNSAGAFGLQNGLTYQNRNIFRGAQLLKLGLNFSAQTQPPVTDNQPNKLFNVLEIGLTASITFPQFLFPVRPERLSKEMKPKTIVSIGYNFQRQQDYDRHITNATFGYNWVQNNRLSHTINPIEIALVKVFGDSSFNAWREGLTDTRLQYQYSDHLVAGLKYTQQYTNQKQNLLKNYIYIRTNFETGGNLLYAIDNIFNAPKNENGYFTLLNIQYSQYIRPDFDFRFYEIFSKFHSAVYRFYAGIGYAYGNSLALPFEKAFFAGGANDIRGWKLGFLGPGSYHNDTIPGNFNQLGDMQLEANFEYRFTIYKMFKGALYMDFGNVWLLRASPETPGGEFMFSDFISQIAISAGLGLRLDFNFFMIRLDPAFPIKCPWYPAGDRWYFDKLQLKDIVWNFGIGYPF